MSTLSTQYCKQQCKFYINYSHKKTAVYNASEGRHPQTRRFKSTDITKVILFRNTVKLVKY